MENLQSTYTHIVNKLRLLHTNNNNLSIFQTTDYKLSLFYTTYDNQGKICCLHTYIWSIILYYFHTTDNTHGKFAVHIHAYCQ